EDVLHGRVEDLAEGERALAARRCGSGSDLRQAPRGGESARGPGFGDARGGDLDVEVLLHGALDQTVEQRILERCPPARYVFRAAAGALAESRGDLHVRPLIIRPDGAAHQGEADGGGPHRCAIFPAAWASMNTSSCSPTKSGRSSRSTR